MDTQNINALLKGENGGKLTSSQSSFHYTIILKLEVLLDEYFKDNNPTGIGYFGVKNIENFKLHTDNHSLLQYE